MKRINRVVLFVMLIALLFIGMATTFEKVVTEINLGLDLQGGFEVLYQVIPSKEGHVVNKELLLHTQAALNKRINVIGVSEPDLSIEGNDRIRVKLAGVTDPEEVRRLLSTEAQLSFRDVNDTLLLDGTFLEEGEARVMFHETTNRPLVSMQFNDPSYVREITTKLLKQPIVIWLDYGEGDSYKNERQRELSGETPKYISAPIVEVPLSTSGSIRSDYWTYQEAKELADLLNAGALPSQLVELSAQSVGAKLGEQAMESTIYAGVIGGVLILIYMLLYYRLPGFIAGISLFGYVYLILVVFNWLNATLTLSGIAALVLGIGMAVDANIITYERLKEEIRAGKTILSSFKVANKRCLITIIDANITTLIAASVLFYFGSGSIKGFAVMLIVSIILSILTAVFGSRLLLSLLVTSRLFDSKPRWFGVKESEISEL